MPPSAQPLVMTPARIDIAPDVPADLRDRLARTRWFDGLRGSGWDYGTDLSYLM